VRAQSENDLRRRVAKHLRSYRAHKGWTQLNLAEKCALPRSYIADLENARRNPSLRTLLRLANAMRVPVQALFDDEA